MGIKREKTKWCSLYVILTETVGVDSCGTICITDIINKLIVKNPDEGTTGIKDYPT